MSSFSQAGSQFKCGLASQWALAGGEARAGRCVWSLFSQLACQPIQPSSNVMKNGTPSNIACQSLSQLYFYWIMQCLNPTVVNVLHSICMSVSPWSPCGAVAVTSFVLQHLHQICCCCKYQSQRWCTRSHDCFKREEPVVWHGAFWLTVFMPWITGKCDWQQNCYETYYSELRSTDGSDLPLLLEP